VQCPDRFSVFFILTPVLGKKLLQGLLGGMKKNQSFFAREVPILNQICGYGKRETGDEAIGIVPVPCEVETLADYFSQPYAVNAFDLGSEHVGGYVYASDDISRRFPCLYRHWVPAYTLHHLFLIRPIGVTNALAFTKSAEST
jgi:hypothetical protein